jgi:hypothetical protein
MTSNTLIHDSSLSWLGTDIPIKSGAAKLVYVSKSHMHTDMFSLSKSKSRPLVIHDLTRVIRRAPLVEKELIILPKFKISTKLGENYAQIRLPFHCYS